jgi:hypothetical protein
MANPTVFHKLVQAAAEHKGLYLRPEEVLILTQDPEIKAAIEQANRHHAWAMLPQDEREHLDCFAPKATCSPPGLYTRLLW